MTIGDVNSNEKGSGARYNEGKPDFSLIPLCTMEDEARVWSYGKKKYAAWNWCKGMDWDVPFSCLMRHMAHWQRGEENDQESGLPHLAHAMCNLRMLTLFSRTYKEGDTRPIKWFEDWLASSDPIPTPLIDAALLVGGDFNATHIKASGLTIDSVPSYTWNTVGANGWTADKRG